MDQQPPYGQPPYGQPPYGQPPYGQPIGGYWLSESDRRMWAMFAHVGALVLGFWAPLIIWLVYKDRDEFVRDQAAEALNFQFAVWIGYAIGAFLLLVLIGYLVLLVVALTALVMHIVAGVAAYQGQRYRYPVALRLVR